VDGDPPARRAAARRLPHALPRAGLDLADLREYQLQDDVRYIDWNVTARLQTPYVRQYNEDREVTAWFLLDVSPSVDFGSADVKKRDVLTEFVAVLARLLTRATATAWAPCSTAARWKPHCRRAATGRTCCT
jgi:uncharacterized protein (DUF58 family)